ncbi:ROK family transcriptional regulator [Paenibacillus sp. TRM 82003]|uniref:ROK family transcriptional regulator n=1 Tax=Kineococcus sp. TRM81007 TaxID=2925831 RepID=UPI001F5A128B|nr:ROK family transcriptional regulator [Kineococcus sp. TRM81007]MCI2236924.1 ROK family transcriptional regulator [Kineococcus sp. TRM81007]MCI3921916.1 ROK family transcriptional regulator [Paenibacillus sp. TRM 82003]
MASRSATRTATTRVVTDINRTAVVDTLRQHGPLSRSGLRVRTGLSPATVDRLCSALLAEGLIERAGVEKSRGGRPSTLFRSADDRRVVVAAEVTSTGTRGLLVSVDGSVVARRAGPRHAGADAGLEAVLQLVGDLVEHAATQQLVVLGTALSVPGIVDGEGRVLQSDELGWQRLAVGPLLEHRFGLPALVENNANAIALGEWSQGAGAGTDSLVAVVLGVGVGAGLVCGGQLVRGARAGAGEIGYLLTGRDAFGRVFAQQGDLESRIGDAAARHRGDRRAAGAAGLLDAVAGGDTHAGELAEELLDYLALSVSALATVFDPEVVVLSGLAPEHIEDVARAIDRRLTGRIPFPPRIAAGHLGDDAPLLGVGGLLARRTKGSVYLA